MIETTGGLLLLILILALLLRRANRRNAEAQQEVERLTIEQQKRVNVDTITKGDEDAGNPN